MSQNSYDGVVEQWKIDLLIGRAQKWGFHGADLDDAQQEVILDVMRFRYDSEKSNGATERTALTAVIDHRLKMILRREARYRKRVETIPVSGDRFEQNGPRSLYSDDKIELRCDTRKAVESLDATDQQICAALADGDSICRIANEMGCGWNTIKRRVDHIRNLFLSIGLAGWIQPDSTAHSSPQQAEPLLITARSAAAMCGKSVRTWRTWDAMGRIPQPVRIGRSTFWRVDELREWVAAGCPSREVWESVRNRRI